MGTNVNKTPGSNSCLLYLSSCHWRSVKHYSRYKHIQPRFLTEMRLSFCSVASAWSQPFPTHPLFLGNAPPIHLHIPSASSPGPNASTLSAFLSPPYFTPVSTEGTRAGFYDKVFCLLFYGPQPMVLHQGWFCSLSGQLEMSGNSFDCHNWREGELTAPRGQRPGLLLNILWCTGQPPTIKNYLVQSAEVEKFCPRPFKRCRSPFSNWLKG